MSAESNGSLTNVRAFILMHKRCSLPSRAIVGAIVVCRAFQAALAVEEVEATELHRPNYGCQVLEDRSSKDLELRRRRPQTDRPATTSNIRWLLEVIPQFA